MLELFASAFLFMGAIFMISYHFYAYASGDIYA